jgi:hypothetical protein
MKRIYTEDEKRIFYCVRNLVDPFAFQWPHSTMSRQEAREVRMCQRRLRLLRELAKDPDSQRLPVVSYPDFPKPHSDSALSARRQVKEYIADFVIIANTPCCDCGCPLLAVVHGKRRCIACDPTEEWMPYLESIHRIVEELLAES